MKPSGGFDVQMFAKMLNTVFDPEVQGLIAAIRGVADFDIPKERTRSFLRFHGFISSPLAKYIAIWRQEKKSEQRWYHRHVNGVLGDVRGALAAAHYHAERLKEIETKLNEILANTKLKQPGSTIGLGGTRILDIEYQAFVLACRRALDYLASALSCYFMRESDSFRTFPKTIIGKKSPEVSKALSEAHSRHVGQLAFVLAEGRKSVRNRIAHYEFVGAGCINLTCQGVFLAGGGEELRVPDVMNGVNLSRALSTRLDEVCECVDDMIDTFVEAAGSDQAR
jgi:hypothetical protein